jgi:hypothetical protein
MIIYLYVKTHNVTGLKYLGKTTKLDPYKYHGSGKYWKLHLKVHGYDYTTEIIKECTSNEEVTEFGLYYSELWNIVESDAWANLKLENGDGGSGLPVGYKRSPETIAKMIVTKMAKYGTLNTQTLDSIEKSLATKGVNGTLNTSSPEAIAKQLTTKLTNGTMNTHTPTSIEKMKATKLANPYKLSPESIEKMLATRRANGTMNPTSPESIAKGIATRARNKAEREKCAP